MPRSWGRSIEPKFSVERLGCPLLSETLSSALCFFSLHTSQSVGFLGFTRLPGVKGNELCQLQEANWNAVWDRNGHYQLEGSRIVTRLLARRLETKDLASS